MNTNEPYHRLGERSLGEAPPLPEHTAEVAALAIHRDPSQPAPHAGPEPTLAKPTVAWVRPTDLPGFLGAPLTRRGIDLQAELTRRARQAPARAGHRITRSAIARPDTPTSAATTREGLGL
ncbi:hypothetical protein [Nocardioides sp.]|uniref:Uncharacterized protein n=1 Tax=metagenome TaxID=256318 RepID=A0A2P2BX74_9ZZZZ